MLSRFRNAVSNVMGGIAVLPAPQEGGRARSHTLGSGDEEGEEADTKVLKYPYNRPAFLQLSSDEVQVSADHVSRPIMVPRDISRLPWNSGYAEVINAGKTTLNEDQACADTLFVPRDEAYSVTLYSGPTTPNHKDSVPPIASTSSDEVQAPPPPLSPGTPPSSPHPSHVSAESSEFDILSNDPLSFTYFGLFDGHAGTGAAIMAVNNLHRHIQNELSRVRDLLVMKHYNLGTYLPASPPPMGRYHMRDRTPDISVDELVQGALERAFTAMDDQIDQERMTYRIIGGCTSVAAIFLLGKLYVANAGDSRAVLVRGEEVISMSKDFSPERDRQRIQYLAYLFPELLHNEFTHLEFPRRLSRRDVGRQVLYRDALMKGWSLKTIQEEDLRFPVIYGEGKKARVLATIGVTRGFGDHDLKVFDSCIYIKPFLSCVPEVLVYDMSEYDHEENDFLIMGSDGLWDVVSNEHAAEIVRKCLQQFEPDDRIRYTSAAQELVMHARGLLRKGWRTPDNRSASGDDITCFIIPLHMYGNQMSQSSSTESSLDMTSPS